MIERSSKSVQADEVRTVAVAERLHVDPIAPGIGQAGEHREDLAGGEVGHDVEDTSIEAAAYEEGAGRVRGPMDEPGGSFSFAHGARKVAPFSIAVFGFGMSFGVLAATDDGLGRAGRDVDDDVRGLGAVRRGVDPRRRRHAGRGGGRRDPAQRPLRADRRERRAVAHGAVVVPVPARSARRRRDLGAVGGRPRRARSEGASSEPASSCTPRGSSARRRASCSGTSSAIPPGWAGRRVPGAVPRAPRAEPGSAAGSSRPRCSARRSRSPSRRSRRPACRSSRPASRAVVGWRRA